MNDIVILKLAAIGDVAAACQALLIFNEMVELTSVRFHWIIDQNLVELARALLNQSGIFVEFHAFSSEKIFRGSTIQKIGATFKLMALSRRLKPQAIVVLHRDSRYRLALQAATPAFVFTLQPNSGTEGSLYLRTLEQCTHKLRLTPKQTSKNKPDLKNNTASQHFTGDTIGILVGGAKNQKVFYEEKRWPHFTDLVAMLLKNTEASIQLFGAPEDQQAAQAILSHVQHSQLPIHRIQDLTGSMSLAQLPQALSKLKTFISIDSGLAHIAAAVMHLPQQKIITLFGPTDHTLWQPMARGQAQVIAMTRNAPCSPCYKNDGRFNPCLFSGEKFRYCLNELQAEAVFNEVVKL